MLGALHHYIKLAVDVQREVVAGGGIMHADCEAALLDDGSAQEDVWAPLVFDDWWVKRLGELALEQFRDAGFFIMKTAESRRPNVLDGENNDLMKSVNLLRLALAISTPRFRTGPGIGGTGANPDGSIELRSTFQYPAIIKPPGERGEQMSGDDIRRGLDLVSPLGRLDRKTRLWKAIVCFSRGVEERSGEDRLHQFVRCIEGFIAPDVGKTKAQFRSRVRSVVRDATPEALDEMFDRRSAIEHLNRAESDSVHRVDEAEAIARFFIVRVLEDARLLATFESDEGIRGFWRQGEKERNAVWGEPLCLQDALSHLRCDDKAVGSCGHLARRAAPTYTGAAAPRAAADHEADPRS